MGFVDRARKLAEQAQEKLDEAQQQFNQGQNPPFRPIQ
jgi:exonuclease VII small subunit